MTLVNGLWRSSSAQCCLMALARPITAGSAAGVVSSWAYRALLEAAYPPLAPVEPAFVTAACSRDLGWSDFLPFLREEVASNWIGLALLLLLVLFRLCNLRALTLTVHLSPEARPKVGGVHSSGKTRLSGYQ